MQATPPLLEVQNLTTQFKTNKGWVTAVNGVSFSLAPGQTLGIVGESGSGKSATALSLLRLILPHEGRIQAAHIYFKQQDLLQLSDAQMRKIRGNHISMIFQEPMTSLNPVYTIGHQVQEVLYLHQGCTPAQAKDKCIHLFQHLGMPDPAQKLQAYPHQLSGGMRQRAMIAMALACNPKLLIADEPTTALDVTIQAQILSLIKTIQQELQMGLILITHDMGVVAEMCDQVAVMYAGRIVEQASTEALFNHPKHPYTKALLEAIPSLSASQIERRLPVLEGLVPALGSLPAGCSFQNRCTKVQEDCKGSLGHPPLEEKSADHQAACFHPYT